MPGQSITLNVSAYVTMPGKYLDNITLLIENGNILTCEVSCFGVGSCILCEPKLSGVLDLGYILTHIAFKKELRFTNKGRKIQNMSWTRYKMISTKEKKVELQS